MISSPLEPIGLDSKSSSSNCKCSMSLDTTHFCRLRPFAFAELVFIIYSHNSIANILLLSTSTCSKSKLIETPHPQLDCSLGFLNLNISFNPSLT